MSYVETLRESYKGIRARLHTAPAVVKPSPHPTSRPFMPSWSLPKPKPRPQYVKPSIVVFNKNSLEVIVEQVAAKHKITLNDMRCDSKPAILVNARQEFCYRAAVESLASYPQIGRFLNRDHSTVMHSIQMYCKRNNIALPRGMQKRGAN